MRCEEFQKLLDAHLDGELAGTLRLEFDAHRVNCPECEHAVTLLEVVSSVISVPQRPAALSPDFTDNVMAQITAPAELRGVRVSDSPIWGARVSDSPGFRAAARRHTGLRAVLVAGALVQAAAIWMLAVVPQNPNRIPITTDPKDINVQAVSPGALTQYISELALQRASVAGDLVDVQSLRQFAMNLNVGDSVALDPAGLLQAWLPVNPPQPPAVPSQAGNQFSF